MNTDVVDTNVGRNAPLDQSGTLQEAGSAWAEGAIAGILGNSRSTHDSVREETDKTA